MKLNDIKLIEEMKEKDYENRITVLSPAEAREELENLIECNGEDIPEEQIYGEAIPQNGVILYVLPSNGEGKAFVYNADNKYSHLGRECEDALEYAYGR